MTDVTQSPNLAAREQKVTAMAKSLAEAREAR